MTAEGAMTKDRWRARARRWDGATVAESTAVVEHLLTSSAVTGATRACLYLPMPGEVDLRALPSRLPDLRWLTTRTADATTLTVHDLDGPMERHPFGYLQPSADAPAHDPASVDTWLLPGLAFAVDGTRLGHGRGYYDRLLAQRRPDATLIAVALDRRVVDDLPADGHDVPMHLLATEHGVRSVTRPARGSPGTAR